MASRTPEVLFLHLFQPDCLQCQAEMEALQGVYEEFADRGVQVVSVAHRVDAQGVQSAADRLGVTFPLALGTGSDAARQVAAGDAMAMLDSSGVVRFAQVGYRPAHGDEPGDEALWRENLALMLDGEPVRQASVDRERLEAGDLLPAVKLGDIFTGEPMVLAGEDGRLTFSDAEGNRIHPRAAIGLFSRYCDFTRQEMKFLQRLSEKYGDEGLFVFAIAMHPDPQTTPQITRDLGVTYPVFSGYGSQLGEQYAYGCPAYIVDAKGVIQYTQVGFEEAEEKKYEAVIRQVLDEAESPEEGEPPADERP